MSLPTKRPPKKKKMTNPRTIAMFKEWLENGARGVAARFGIAEQTVRHHSSKYGWSMLKQQIADHKYNELRTANKIMAAKLQRILEMDVARIIAKIEESQDKPLSEADRAHVVRLQERVLKEIRLDDGKPTDLPGESRGMVTVRIEVPEGVSYLDAIPPIGQGDVIEVDAETVKEEKDDEYDPDDFT